MPQLRGNDPILGLNSVVIIILLMQVSFVDCSLSRF
jgi:hypothetical protein